MDVLGRDYVNAWILGKDLRAIAEGAGPVYVRRLAALARQSYLSPVDCQIYSSTGELLDHVNANKLLSGEASYIELLKAPWRERSGEPGASDGSAPSGARRR